MLRTSLIATAAFLGGTALALAAQPANYTHRSRMAAPSTETSAAAHPGKSADRFASESEAKAHCGSGTVVWVNTKTHVYHFAGSSAFGHTKHGAFMCQADADRTGKLHAAKNETPAGAERTGSSAPPRR